MAVHVAADQRVYPPFACVAFTKLIVFPEETIPVVAGDFFSGLNVPQHLHTRCISSCRHKLHTQQTRLRARLSLFTQNGMFVSLSKRPTLQFGRQSETKYMIKIKSVKLRPIQTCANQSSAVVENVDWYRD